MTRELPTEHVPDSALSPVDRMTIRLGYGADLSPDRRRGSRIIDRNVKVRLHRVCPQLEDAPSRS